MIRAFVITVICAATVFATPADATSLAVVSGSRVTLEGTTNVHPWRCESTGIRGALTMDAPWPLLEVALASSSSASPGSEIRTLPGGVSLPQPSFAAAIPVRSFDCGNRIMEADLRNALRATEAPEIIFRYVDLIRVTSESPRPGASAAWYLNALVDLRLAGTSKAIPMVLRVDRLSATRFHLVGSTELRMTDFGITPPTGLFGMIRAADQLEVDVSLLLQAQ